MDFVYSAMPWVIAGLAVAVICIGMGNRETGDREKQMEEYTALGAGLGLMAGVAMSLSGVIGHPIGIAEGPLVGMALATLIGRRLQRKDRKGNGKCQKSAK